MHVDRTGFACYAKRTGYLKEGDAHFRYQEMLERDFNKLHSLAMAVHSFKENSIQRVCLYGELFGGLYPGMKNETKLPV